MSIESLKHHLKHVKELHDKLDKEITEAYNHHDADNKVHDMKKRKLHLKEEIVKCEAQIKLGKLTP